MPRKINRLQDAKPILEKIHTELVGTINNAFSDWLQIRAFSNTLEGGPVNYKPRTKAGIIHDHIEKFVRTTFTGRDGIIVDDYKGVFGMVIQDELFRPINIPNICSSVRYPDSPNNLPFFSPAISPTAPGPI